MTTDLARFVRSLLTGPFDTYRNPQLVAEPDVNSLRPDYGRGSSLTRRLADAQDRPSTLFTRKHIYRLYLEDTYRGGSDVVADTVARYFEGATIFSGLGLDSRAIGGREHSIMIEIVSSKPDALQRVVNLAGDLRILCDQVSLLTRDTVDTFEVTAATV